MQFVEIGFGPLSVCWEPTWKDSTTRRSEGSKLKWNVKNYAWRKRNLRAGTKNEQVNHQNGAYSKNPAWPSIFISDPPNTMSLSRSVAWVVKIGELNQVLSEDK